MAAMVAMMCVIGMVLSRSTQGETHDVGIQAGLRNTIERYAGDVYVGRSSIGAGENFRFPV